MIFVSVLVYFDFTTNFALFETFFSNTTFTKFFKILTTLGAAASLIICKNYFIDTKINRYEIPTLLLFSTLGMMLMISSKNLMMMYLAIELQSLSLYVVASIKRNSLESAESGVKYFILGALSSGILLYGFSLVYGFTGQTSFDGIYISGAVMSNDLGIPDIGLTTLNEVGYRANQICRVTDLPSIVDADTGFNNCKKTIETFESLGLSGCHIEDQIAEKRCGHLDNKELITKEEMVKKIKESIESRKDKNFLIIVRTDANTVEGIDKTLDRIKAYEEAGADMIFPEAMKDESEFEKVRKISKGYLLANMTEFGKSKLLNKTQLENLGYNLVIYPVTTQRLAMQNVENGLKSIFKDGHQNNIIDKMQTRKRLYELVEYEKYNTPGKKITDFSTEGHE